jgi:hypothetical protein
MNLQYCFLFFLVTNVFCYTASADFPDDFTNVVWLDPDVSQWAETHSLTVSFNGGAIAFNSTATSTWPIEVMGQYKVVGNAWVFVEDSGTWYASTFEYMVSGQVEKNAGAVNGTHTKKAQIPKNFQPAIGSKIGFMLSGIIRHPDPTYRNIEERTNPTIIKWPRDFEQYTGGLIEQPLNLRPNLRERYGIDDPADSLDQEIVRSENCEMFLCLHEQVTRSGQSNCRKAARRFFNIVERDVFGKPDPRRTYAERLSRLSSCGGAKPREIGEIMSMFGHIIK